MDIARAEMLGNNLLHHYLSTKPFLGWSWRWDRGVRRFGVCKTRRRTITISKVLTELNSEDQFLDIFLHEIAHALAPITAGHGHHWRFIAKTIGCNPERCYDKSVVAVPGRYHPVCAKCGHKFQPRHRRPRHNSITHRGCGGFLVIPA